MKTSLTLLLCSSFFLTGCATTYVDPVTEIQTPPTESFSKFDRFILVESQIAPEFSLQDANQKAARKIDENLLMKLKQIHQDAESVETVSEIAQKENEHALIIEPKVKQIKFISGGARFWAGAAAGSSAINMHVTFTDSNTGEVIAEPEFYQHANAYAGAWSMGGADNAMLVRITSLITEYISVHSEE